MIQTYQLYYLQTELENAAYPRLDSNASLQPPPNNASGMVVGKGWTTPSHGTGACGSSHGKGECMYVSKTDSEGID